MEGTNEIAKKLGRLKFLDERKTDLMNRMNEINNEMANDKGQEPVNC